MYSPDYTGTNDCQTDNSNFKISYKQEIVMLTLWDLNKKKLHVWGYNAQIEHNHIICISSLTLVMLNKLRCHTRF